MHAWLIWLIVALALAAAETFSLDLVLIMCAGGATAAALVAALGAAVPLQMAVAVLVTLVMLLFLRPVAQRHMVAGAPRSGVSLLIGKSALTLTEITAQGGRVRLNGGEWSARSYRKQEVIAAGHEVRVMKISGATAEVATNEQEFSE